MTATQSTTQVGSASAVNLPANHQVVIVGGGAAGITVAAQLLKQVRSLDVAIVEPSWEHYYQPAWTLVGGGCMPFEETVRPEKDHIPEGATWIQAAIARFEPEQNAVITEGGQRITYENLVVCPGIQIDWGKVKGLPEALGKGGVCSNYAINGATYTWQALQAFKGGNALFTYPQTPIKCAGAPQKIMYLADDVFRQKGVRDQTHIRYCTATGGIFGVAAFVPALMAVIERKGIDLKTNHTLIEIRPEEKLAIFRVSGSGEGETAALPYDLIHVTPPMSAPDFIKQSPLANEAGWVDVDKFTTQHNRYPNVFSLGDASSLPTSKTAAAIRREAPVLVQNLLNQRWQKPLSARYNGYSCCPLITGYGKVILAEFDYDGNPYPSFPIDPTQERRSMWALKRHVLPWVYWHRMLKGEPHEGNYLRRLFA